MWLLGIWDSQAKNCSWQKSGRCFVALDGVEIIAEGKGDIFEKGIDAERFGNDQKIQNKWKAPFLILGNYRKE